jgi:integrase/recombinase XerD
MDSSLKLADSVAEFLAEVQNGRAKSTYFAYRVCLTEFRDGSQRRTLAGLDRKDVLAFISALRQRGMSERTIAHRLQLLKTFFLHYKVMWPLLKIDRIRYTEKTVEAYNSEELQRLFAAANQNEIDLFQFLLCTGVREQEAMYATWRDVDFFRKTFKVTEKRDLGFTPKDKEEGVIPIPDSLVVLLQARRKRYPHSRLIFGLANGEADFHFLRTLQNLAFRAGMNCGECYTKSGKKCCATAAMCKHWGLHKFRKTFATLHHEAGVPVRTIQRWLRHSSLETTLRYLAGGDDRSEKTRAQVNSTFAGLQRSDPPVAPIIGPSPGRKVLLM